MTCPIPGGCGQLSSQHTSSGQARPTASRDPLRKQPGRQIVAFATMVRHQHGRSVIVGTFDSNLKGTYVLEAQGVDFSFRPTYQFAA